MEIRVKSIYDEPESEDGIRILVDRLWPRDIAKNKAKELTPSHDLRKWFYVTPDRLKQFAKRYKAKLAERRDEIKSLFNDLDQNVVTLVTAIKDLEHGQVVVLKSYIQKMLDRS